jgi:cell division protein ZapA (FtsZ GTPase activity inhibitor)
MEELEYNILGSKIKLKPDEADRDKALMAVELVNKEIETLKKHNPKLSDVDTAVLVALKIATNVTDINTEYKNTVSSFKSSINEALGFMGSISENDKNL